MGDGYVTALGPVDMDEYVLCTTPLLLGAKCMVRSEGWFPGGLVANAAGVLGTLGKKTYLLDTLGQDNYTEALVKSLQVLNVDTDYLQILPGYENLKTTVYLSEGDRTICIHENSKPPVTMDQRVKDLVFGSEFLYTTIYSLKELEGAAEFLEELKEHKVGIMLDVEPVTFESRRRDRWLFEAADILSFNEASYAKYRNGECTDHARALADMGKTVMVTMGRNGCRICTPQQELFIPAMEVETVDTTGAGDTHNAAFLYAYLKGWKTSACGYFAAAAAARSVTIKGPQSGAVSEQTVLEFWKEMEEHGYCRKSEKRTDCVLR